MYNNKKLQADLILYEIIQTWDIFEKFPSPLTFNGVSFHGLNFDGQCI